MVSFLVNFFRLLRMSELPNKKEKKRECLNFLLCIMQSGLLSHSFVVIIVQEPQM